MADSLRLRTLALAVVLIALAVVAVFAVERSRAEAAGGDGGWIDHPGLVPDQPERLYPVLLTTPYNNGVPRQSRAVDMIGPYIISGGDFLEVQLPNNGGIVNQPYLAIFDSRDKSLVCTDLDVNNEVWAIAPGPTANTAIIGGRFTKVTGPDGIERTRSKVALIDLDACDVSKTWIVQGGLNGKVTELAVTGNRLFIGGDFENIGGTNIDHIAEVSLDNAVLNTAFDPNFENELTRAVLALEVSPDGTRLGIVHRATRIMGDNMRGSAIFDISDPNNITLTDHEMEPNAGVGGGAGVPYDRYYDIQDGAISPDFSTIVIVQGTATVADYVTALPTVEDFTFQTWQHYMRDSSFGVAATNDIVYVTGHFCKIDTGPGATDIMAPNSGPSTCTGTQFDGGAWRTQMAALDIADGTPLTWNPGNNAFVGARAVTVVNRGLLVGMDGDRADNILTGTTAFFDFGAPPDPREDQQCTASVNGVSVDLSWDSVSDVNDYIVRRNNSWIASPGDTTSYTDFPPSGTHTYYIRTTLDGVEWDTECEPSVTVTVPDQTCDAVLNADNTVTITWDAIPGEDTWFIRKNGKYRATVSNTLTYTEAPGEGIHTYVVKSVNNGVTTNTTCDPTITIVLPDQTCTAVLNADESITITWDDIPGEDKYFIRRNGGYIATVDNALTFTDSPGEGSHTYVVRSTLNNELTVTTCTPTIDIDGPPPQTCTVVDNGDGTATLTWTDIAGEDKYFIRRNGGYIATVDNALTYTATGHTAGDTYVVRSNMNGVQTNTTCA